MSAHFNCNLSCNGLKVGEKYALSISWAGESGGVNTGLSEVTADSHGVVKFPLSPTLLETIASAKGPGVLTMWVRKGGGTFDDPPVSPRAKLVFEI